MRARDVENPGNFRGNVVPVELRDRVESGETGYSVSFGPVRADAHVHDDGDIERQSVAHALSNHLGQGFELIGRSFEEQLGSFVACRISGGITRVD